MIRRTDQERLLADVLREEAGSDFHNALLDETLRLARRRRQARLVRRLIGVCAIIALTMTIAIWRRSPVPLLETRPPYQLTFSRPLPSSCVVSSQPFRTDQIVSSTPASSIVHTTSGRYSVLGDDELLALAPVPAALVRYGPQEVRLVFVCPMTATDGRRIEEMP